MLSETLNLIHFVDESIYLFNIRPEGPNKQFDPAACRVVISLSAGGTNGTFPVLTQGLNLRINYLMILIAVPFVY